jgi:tRNA threonylcarbamoyladenosine biosynthesis protein TsaB
LKSPALLALDSSTETLCLAACAEGRERLWQGAGGAQASIALLSQAKALLLDLGVDWTQLDAVAFAQGPGAFTGLRTACSTAQGLAFGVGCGVLAIDSLMMVAEAATCDVDQMNPFVVGVVMDARMGEVYAAVYRATRQGWQVLDAPQLTTLAALRSHWPGRTLQYLAGNLAEDLKATHSDFGLLSAINPSDDARTAALLSLARQAWSSGRVRAAHEAVPLYVRDKVAQTVSERAALTRAAGR